MKKILSICIPSYNMEKYIARCLDSLLVPSINKLEILVVNDGSKDNTLRVAKEYESKYSDSIVVIDKTNGHYGSTVNAALKIAKGKYFRILDADDRFDTVELETFINTLEKIDADCVFTKYSVHDFNEKLIDVRDYTGIIYDKVLNMDNYVIPVNCYAMHSLTYKLDLLKSFNYQQTEGICYTDTEYVFYPLQYARSIYNVDIFLYRYYMGRDEQSMAFKSLFKNFTHFTKIFDRIFSYSKMLNKSSNINIKNIQDYYILAMMQQICLVGILSNNHNEYFEDVFSRIKLVQSFSDKLYKDVLKIKYKHVPYVYLWLEHRIICKPLFFLLRKIVSA